MSAHGQERHEQVDELLKSLDVKKISCFHNSLNISFRQMLDYMDKTIHSVRLPADIEKLFLTYKTVAEVFYEQFERTLLEKIKDQKEIERCAFREIKRIEKLPDNDLTKKDREQAFSLLYEDHHRAYLEFKRLKESYPALLQSALDKLRNEWQRLNALVVANRVLDEDKRLARALNAVAEVAAHTVGVEAERIAIVPGKAFALEFFTYLDNFAMLTVPIYSVQTPWEWSIFWHELAGYKVRRLEKAATIEKARKKLKTFHEVYRKADKTTKCELLASVSWDSRFCQDYLDGIFSKKVLDLEDLEGFEDQFAKVIAASLPTADKFHAYDKVKAEGWCVDWFKELFEDAWSIVAIGEPFLKLFKDILARNPAEDECHPPANIRLKVAKHLLKLLNSKNKLKDEPHTIECVTAQQILRFMSLLRVAARQYKKPGLKTEQQLWWQDTRDTLFEKVRDEIQASIANWSENFLTAENPLRRVRSNTKNILETLLDPKVERLISRLHTFEVGQLEASYRNLLQDRNYEQLLMLSFSEVDYHTPGDIQLLKDNTPYWVKPTDWHSESWLAQRRRLGNGTLSTEIVILEVNTNISWRVKTADWISWFKMPQ